jgi:hypothetical protein
MGRGFLVSIVIVNCVLFLQLGCQKQLKTDLAAKAEPKIKFEKPVYDFGEVGSAQKKIAEFKFSNIGTGLLKIEKVNVCCRFTAKLDKKEFKPGETGTLKIEYNSVKYLGPITQTFYVFSNDKINPMVELTISAKVVIKIAWEPQDFKIFSDVVNGACPKITISSLDNKPFSIKEFKSTLNCITADIAPSVYATKFVLEPKVDTTKLEENMRGFVHIISTYQDWNTISIPFEVWSRFKTNPTMITVLNAESKSPVIRYMEVLNNFGEDFAIESTSSQNNFIKLLSQKKVSNGYQLEIEITPPAAKEEQQMFTDTFYINIKDGKKIEVPCTGFYLIKE